MTDEQRETCDLLADTMKEEARLHRLVEEAKGDAKKHALANVALRAEVDRLKGELDAAKFRNDALESLIDTERQTRKETENTLFFVRKDLQRLKSELATEREAHRKASGDAHH